MNYSELLKEKTIIRSSDPIKASVLSIITSSAASIAKAEMREVKEDDLLAVVKKEVKDTEKIIELTKSKGGNTETLERELAIYKSYLPSMLDENATKEIVLKILSEYQGERSKKIMGKIISDVKAKNIIGIDYSIVSKILQSVL